MTKVPEEFCRIMRDFTKDVLHTFPEYEKNLDKGLSDVRDEVYDTSGVVHLFEYCQKIYPERFFDFLYQNESIFTDTSKNTMFLPNIEFKDIWRQPISDKTRLIIWKYLQLVLFALVNSGKEGQTFGDTSRLFEAINEEELKKKLEETMEQMGDLFKEGCGFFGTSPDVSGINIDELPDPEELHKHISGMMEGKLGRLAAEITEETMKEFQDISGVKSVGDVFNVMFKDPGRLLKMIKKIGSDLDEKMKSGEIKESELLEEAADLMSKLDKMPGMKNMQQMFSQMGMAAPGKGKVNMGALQGQLGRNIRSAKTKERMRRKLHKRNEDKDKQIRLLQEQIDSLRKVNDAQAEVASTNEKTSEKRGERKKKKKGRRRKKRGARNKK